MGKPGSSGDALVGAFDWQLLLLLEMPLLPRTIRSVVQMAMRPPALACMILSARARRSGVPAARSMLAMRAVNAQASGQQKPLS